MDEKTTEQFLEDLQALHSGPGKKIEKLKKFVALVRAATPAQKAALTDYVVGRVRRR